MNTLEVKNSSEETEVKKQKKIEKDGISNNSEKNYDFHLNFAKQNEVVKNNEINELNNTNNNNNKNNKNKYNKKRKSWQNSEIICEEDKKRDKTDVKTSEAIIDNRWISDPNDLGSIPAEEFFCQLCESSFSSLLLFVEHRKYNCTTNGMLSFLFI